MAVDLSTTPAARRAARLALPRFAPRTLGRLITAGAAVLAFVMRWIVCGGARGVRGYHGYDDGVYFASAVALVHGRLPYRDFLFLHPPGITLVLAPFAALTHVTSDSNALVAARVGFMLVGAASAALVTRIAWRWGAVPAVVGGLLYAVAAPAVYTERLTMLEPLGTVTLLGGVLLLLRSADEGARPWWTWAGGAVLGLGVVVKIWDVVPVLVVLVSQLAVRGWQPALRAALAAAAAASVVVLPFAAPAGSTMFRYVVLDQVGRARDGLPTMTRLLDMTGLNVTNVTDDPSQRRVLLVVVGAVVVTAAVVAWRARRGRLWVVMLAAQGSVVLLAPTYLPSYAAFCAPALVLVVAAGVAAVPDRTRVPVAVLVCVPLALVVGAFRPSTLVDFPTAAMAARLPDGCIQADAPAALALLDVLSRDLDEGCDVAVDLSGQTLDAGGTDPSGASVDRIDNRPWQLNARTYLMSGEAMVLARAVGNSFDPETLAVLHRWPAAVDVRGIQLRLPPG
ncbi:glycosyltransferase 87 family protein [Cellulomonas sp. URHD0024]|uniref:glycosyltransferase 87 family protein n=1 Tax=Cellulomonas sp. URHD0024 TaxID=1302620 RepID=UPI0003FBFA84|nr:glycosyltransferase 87 family protein [Cellulomonas sp. URHD0024]